MMDYVSSTDQMALDLAAQLEAGEITQEDYDYAIAALARHQEYGEPGKQIKMDPLVIKPFNFGKVVGIAGLFALGAVVVSGMIKGR